MFPSLSGWSETAFRDDLPSPDIPTTVFERLADGTSLPEVILFSGLAAFVFYWLGRGRSRFGVTERRTMDMRGGWRTWAARFLLGGVFAFLLIGPGGLMDFSYRRHGFNSNHWLTYWLTLLGLIGLSAAVASAVEFAVKVFAGRRT